MKRNMLIASFFAILMLMMPLTTITGYVSISGAASSSDKETGYLVTFSREEIGCLRVILDRMLKGEIKLTESEIVTVKGIRNKLTCEKVDLTRSEIKLLLEIFCRITDGAMKLTDYEIKTLRNILSKISDAVAGVELSDGELEYLDGVLNLNAGKIKLTESQISQLEDIANSFEDAEARVAAHNLVNQLVNSEGELDLAQVQLLFSSNYQPAGIIGSIIKDIIHKITDKVMEILLQLIQEYLLNRFAGGRSGWVGPTVGYFINITIVIQTVKTSIESMKNDINSIRTAVQLFITFFNQHNLKDLFNLVLAIYQAYVAVYDLWDNIINFPELMRSSIENLYVNTTNFAVWFVPDMIDPVNYTEIDRPYNKIIHLNIQVLGIEPDQMQNVEIYCDYQIYTPPPDGLLEIEYSTVSKTYPYWIHIIGLTATDKNTNPHRTSTITDDGFSLGSFGIIVDFTGRPNKPYGPTDVIRFDTHLYETYAINPSGSSDIYYQWDWGEYMEDWYGPRQSGSTESRPHTWLTPGTFNVKVRAGDTLDGSGWVSGWSEPLTVTVYRIFDISLSQQMSQNYGSYEVLMNSMSFNLMEMMIYEQPNAN